MKTVLTKFLALSSIGLLALASCKKSDPMVKTNGGTPGTLSANTSTPVLDKTKLNDTTKVVNFTFTKPAFGFSAAVTNTLQIDAQGDNWANPTSVTLGNGKYSQGYSTNDFNNMLLKLNLPAGVASQVNVRLQSSLGSGSKPIYSNMLNLTVTPFNLTSWLYITGAFSGWQNPGPQEDSLVSITGNGVYTGIINFNATTADAKEFLILPVKKWDHKYATNEPKTQTSTTVTYDAGNNLVAPGNGHYLITFNSNTGTITFTPADYYSIIGNAANGWNDGDDVDMKYINDGSGDWVATTTLSVQSPPNDGYKIRKNHAWTTSYGTISPTDGKSLTSNNGVNIGNAVAGTYKITFWLNPADNTGVTAFYTAIKQ
jgi:hypothetical protein